MFDRFGQKNGSRGLSAGFLGVKMNLLMPFFMILMVFQVRFRLNQMLGSLRPGGCKLFIFGAACRRHDDPIFWFFVRDFFGF